MTEINSGPTLKQLLVDLDEAGVLNLVKESLRQGDDPLTLLEDCQEGMHQVGLYYERQEYYLSGLMMAGEIFREAMELIEPVLQERFCGHESGHILLGTAQGDIHDIGKNMFGTMMRCHGFTVTDLGVDVKPAVFLDAAQDYRPDIISLSGLLTISYDTMQQTVRLIRRSAAADLARAPVIIGGGLLNAKVCAYVGADYWSIDGMVGVNLCKQIMAQRSKALVNS